MEPTLSDQSGNQTANPLCLLSRTDQQVNGHTNDPTRAWRLQIQFESFESEDPGDERTFRHTICQPYEFEGLLVDILARFVNLPSEELELEIEAALGRVCDFLGLERAGLWHQGNNSPDSMVLRHRFIRPIRPATGVEPADLRANDCPERPVLPVGANFNVCFPWMAEQVKRGRAVVISKPDDLPTEAETDNATLARVGIRACTVVPLLVEGEVRGAVSFSMVSGQRAWPTPLLKRLEFVTEVFAQATSRTLAYERLRASEDLLKLASASAEVGIWSLDLRTRQVQATAKAYELLQLPPDTELTFERFLSIIHPEDRGRVQQATEEAIRGQSELDLEFRVVLADGSLHWVSARGRFQCSPGTPERLMGVACSITARKQTEKLLRESEVLFRTVADSAPVLLWMSDADHRWSFFNKPWLAFTGQTLDQGPAGGWTEGMHPDDLPRCMQLYTTAFEASKPFSVQYRRRRHDGEYRWILDNGVPRHDPQGKFAGYIGSGVDVTEQKLAEQALLSSCAEIKQLKDRLQVESDYLKAEIKVKHAHGDIIGRSLCIRRVLHQVEQVAVADCPVLITGETGTGKELVAQEIHRLSARKERMMVLVNCAALPTALVESELFGRERGAYTGALTSQVGRFEIANNSTIFLDEIGELSLEVQAKLLRVLQEGDFQRLGSPKTYKSDVRVIAATNRDLAEAVRKGKFREDLYYRLRVFPIEIPPLRERLEDIPMLVFAFLEDFATRMGKKINKIPRRSMELLQKHSWPGNIRELRNVIEHSVILTNGDTLKLTALGEGPSRDNEPVTLAEAERAHILRTLQSSGWRIKGPHGAAARLDLQPSTLYSRMQKLGIPHRRQKDEMTTIS